MLLNFNFKYEDLIHGSHFTQFPAAVLQPLEHKWIVRIILGGSGNIGIGVGFETMIRYFNEDAPGIFNSNRSLRNLCSSISDPKWMQLYGIRRRHKQKILMKRQR